MDQFAERRQHIRVPLTYVTVEVAPVSEKEKSSETCSIIDISEGGMKFVSRGLYEIFQSLNLVFVIPGSTIHIRTKAVVVYQLLKHSLYTTGVQFTELNLTDLTILKAYIAALTKKN